MADSADGGSTTADGSSVPEPRDSTVTRKLVGGLQWALTVSYCFLLGLAVAAWYLRVTRTPVSLDLTGAFAVAVLVAFAAGYRWVGSRSPASGAHARRVETVVTLLVLGFLFPFTLPRLLARLGVASRFALAGFGLAYALALACSYGLVYGLGVRFFLGPDPDGLRAP